MKKTNYEKLLNQKRLLWQKLIKLKDCLPGNLNAAYLICNRGKCKCTRGERHGPSWRLTWKEKQKTKILYVRNKEVQEVKIRTQQYTKAKEILRKIAFVNLELLKLKRDK
jgi:hypothetical protein